MNSHLAARLPAVVVSVEHRLLAPGIPLSAAADDGLDAPEYVNQPATQWALTPPELLSPRDRISRSNTRVPQHAWRVPQARPARAEIVEFLRGLLTG